MTDLHETLKEIFTDGMAYEAARATYERMGFDVDDYIRGAILALDSKIIDSSTKTGSSK